jgi:hypothetical protein
MTTPLLNASASAGHVTVQVPPKIYLTPIERRVLGALTFDGAQNDLIAARVGLSPDTVKTHMRSILAKANKALGYTSPEATRLTRTSLCVKLLKRHLAVQVCQSPFMHDAEHTPPIGENHRCVPPVTERAVTTLPAPRSG